MTLFAGVAHVEVPVTDMDRAVAFYQQVFDLELAVDHVDGYPMAFFPETPGASLALVQGDVYVPAKAGPIAYLSVESIDKVIERVMAAGGQLLYPKTDVGEHGFVAEFEDLEGNRVALLERR